MGESLAALKTLPPEFWWRTAAAAAPQVGLPGLGVPFEVMGGATEFSAAGPQLKQYLEALRAKETGGALTPEQRQALVNPPRSRGQIAGGTLEAVERRQAQAEQLRRERARRQLEQTQRPQVEAPRPTPSIPLFPPPLLRPTAIPSVPWAAHQASLDDLIRELARGRV